MPCYFSTDNPVVGAHGDVACMPALQCRRHLACRANRGSRTAVVAQAAAGKYDYDLVIIGCGVGGHGAALHAVEQVGGTKERPYS